MAHNETQMDVDGYAGSAETAQATSLWEQVVEPTMSLRQQLLRYRLIGLGLAKETAVASGGDAASQEHVTSAELALPEEPNFSITNSARRPSAR
jgi:hypothetical protein